MEIISEQRYVRKIIIVRLNFFCLKNFMKILKQFSQSKEHANAQCCIICLMSHGEEGSLTVQDGKKVSH